MHSACRFVAVFLLCLMAADAAACAAITKKGTVCKRPASPGSAYCWQHGGSTKAERDAAYVKTQANEPAAEQAKAAAEASVLTVARIVDGDTLVLSNGVTVRLIGIDAPESHESEKLDKDAERTQQDKATIKALGKRCSDHLAGLCKGEKVTLQYDQTKEDVYGRVLAYVHLADGTDVNAAMIKNGYAYCYTKYPFKRMADYRDLGAFARAGKAGLWATEDKPAVFDEKAAVEQAKAEEQSATAAVYKLNNGTTIKAQRVMEVDSDYLLQCMDGKWCRVPKRDVKEVQGASVEK